MKFAPGAWKYALLPLLAAPFALLYSVALSIVALLAGVFTLVFFRDPERTPPATGAVSPADGSVSVLRTEGDRVRLGVFMNVWHVHVIRAPFDAHVVDVEHIPGAHKPAFSKDSDRNERVHVTLEPKAAMPTATDGASTDAETADSDGNPDDTAVVTFIAGAFARRIHPYVEAGDTLERGQRIGHIAFGSRVDTLFPPGITRDSLAVSQGDSMTAGETVIFESVTDDFPFGIGGTNALLEAAGESNSEDA